jgi:hypothetical protein
MRAMGVMLFVLCGCLVGATAVAARVEVFDRATGEVLQTYRHQGRLYVAGEPGHEYEIRVHSRAPQRTLAVATVDGVNVITGQTGATDQDGYVLDPYGYLRIEGWRKSMTHTAAFYFTKLSDSYAARTGRPDNVGVIGVALFRERVRCCRRNELELRERSSAEAPSADRAASAPKAESKLGTGHGRSEYSAAEYTEFERASDRPDETIVIYYDSRRNLQARGIIRSPVRYAERTPQPFPGGFVPDP